MPLVFPVAGASAHRLLRAVGLVGYAGRLSLYGAGRLSLCCLRLRGSWIVVRLLAPPRGCLLARAASRRHERNSSPLDIVLRLGLGTRWGQERVLTFACV